MSFETAKLIWPRRAEFEKAIAECTSTGELTKRLNVSLYAARRAAKEIGVELPRGRIGRPTKLTGEILSELIAMRETGASYSEIACKFPFTKQTVAHGLKKTRPELCGYRTKIGLATAGHDKICLQCETEFHTNSRRAKFCSRRCFGKSVCRDDRGKAAYDLRRAGVSWKDVGQKIWGKTNASVTAYAWLFVKRYGVRNGIDVSDAYGWRHDSRKRTAA